jgi:hypothetical protein
MKYWDDIINLKGFCWIGVQPLMLGKAKMDGLSLINNDLQPCP